MGTSLSSIVSTVQKRSLDTLNTAIARKGEELSSGSRVRAYEDLPEVRAHLRASDSHQRLQATQSILATETDTLSHQEISTRTILDEAKRILTEIIRVRDASSEPSSFALNVSSALTVIEGALNAKNGDGRFVFGRDVQGTQSVDFSQIQDATLLLGGSIAEEYYAGGTVAPQVTLDGTSNTFDLTVDASNQGFDKIIRALKLASIANNDSVLLGTALDTLTEGIADTADLVLSVLGTQQRVLEDSTTRLAQESLAAREALSENIDANVTQTYTEFINIQMHLQATMSFIQKLNSTLSDFISKMR